MSVSKTILVGNLGVDPTVRYGKDGSAICSFSLATSERWKGKDGQKQERTEWHKIVIFGKLAEIAGEYLSSGKQIYVEGKNQTREWEDADGNKRQTTEVVCHVMTMLGQGQGAGQGSSSSGGESASSGEPNSVEGGEDFEDQDIPF